MDNPEKIYRVVINQDPNSINIFDFNAWAGSYRWRHDMTPEDIIREATSEVKRMYSQKSTAKGRLTSIRHLYGPIDGWIEESELSWSKS